MAIDRICSLIKKQIPLRNRGLLDGSGTVVPVDGTDGWQTGAFFQKTDGGANTAFYVNEGTVTACSFRPVEVGTDVAGESEAIEFADDQTGPLISIDTTDPTGTSYTTPFLITGTYSSDCALGIQLSATNQRPVSFLFDDGAAVLGSGNYRGVLSRVMLCATQTGQVAIRAIRGQVKVADAIDVNIATNEMNAFNGVEGYIELSGATAKIIGANTRVAAVHALLEVNQDITLTAGGKMVGVFSELSQVTAKTVGGIGTAAFAADRLDSDHTTNQALWTVGFVTGDGSCTTGMMLGTSVTGISFPGTYTTGIDFTTATLAMDASRTNAAIVIGDRLGAKTITFAAAVNHFDPIQINLLTAGVNPTDGSTVNSIYQLITHAVDMSSLRLKCADWNIATSKDVKDMYVYQGEIDVTAASVTVGNQAAGLGIVMNAGADAVTCGYWEGIAVTMTGAGTPAATSQGFYLSVASGCTIASGILLSALGTISAGITLSGAGTFPIGIDINTCTVGIDIAGCVTPNSTRTNHALVIGGRASELSVAFASGVGVESYEPIQMNFDFAGYNPDNVSTVNVWQGAITLDTDDLANVRLKWSDLLTTVGKDCRDVYIHQAEIDFGSSPSTVSNQVAAIGVYVHGGTGGVTCGTYSAISATLGGTGTPANAICVHVCSDASCVVASGIQVQGADMVTAIRIGDVAQIALPTNAFAFPAIAVGGMVQGYTTQETPTGKIRILVDGSIRWLAYWD